MLAAAVATVKIGVFGLFHPVELEVKPAPGQVLMVMMEGSAQTLERSQALLLKGEAKVTGRNGSIATFDLSIPGRLTRRFTGKLQVFKGANGLVPVVEIDREAAVRAIVGAEMVPGVPFEAMKAQAVAVRSYLAAAKHRHEGYDFCDTTHCQYMKAEPSAYSGAAKASDMTKGMVVSYQGEVVATLYSGNCGGHTRSLAEAGWNPDDYPYFGVACPAPGKVAGHQLGLCQTGAITMAKKGATYNGILAHFYPATRVMNLEQTLKSALPSRLLDPFVLFHFPVPDVDNAMGVKRDIVLVSHQHDRVPVRVQTVQ